MPKPELITARYAQGLSDYNAGHGLATVFATLVLRSKRCTMRSSRSLAHWAMTRSTRQAVS
jgi:hypothetical protein